MAETSKSNFGKQIGLCFIAASVLYLVVFLYLEGVAGESNPGLTRNKILVVVFLFLGSNVAQTLIAFSASRTGLFPVFLTNVEIWLPFFGLLFLDALLLHPGIAKDAITDGLAMAVRFFLVQFALLGIPVILVNTLLGVTVVRFVNNYRLRGTDQ